VQPVFRNFVQPYISIFIIKLFYSNAISASTDKPNPEAGINFDRIVVPAVKVKNGRPALCQAHRNFLSSGPN